MKEFFMFDINKKTLTDQLKLANNFAQIISLESNSDTRIKMVSETLIYIEFNKKINVCKRYPSDSMWPYPYYADLLEQTIPDNILSKYGFRISNLFEDVGINVLDLIKDGAIK